MPQAHYEARGKQRPPAGQHLARVGKAIGAAAGSCALVGAAAYGIDAAWLAVPGNQQQANWLTTAAAVYLGVKHGTVATRNAYSGRGSGTQQRTSGRQAGAAREQGRPGDRTPDSKTPAGRAH